MSLGQEIAPHLPFIRRFARALLSSQARGDYIVRSLVERIIADPDALLDFSDLRVGLYTLLLDVVQEIEDRRDAGEITEIDNLTDDDGGYLPAEGIASRRLSRIPGLNRIALLLTSLEGFSSKDTAAIINSTPEVVDELVETALEEIERQTLARVLIVEDEPIVAMDIASIVRDLGHDVVGIAASSAEAIQMADDSVGLVLMDVELSDGATGIDAAVEITRRKPRPIIFVTAFPERLLTNRKVEPSFLISKPFQRSTVKAAIAQALFFDSASVPVEPITEVQPTAADPVPRLIQARQISPKPGPVNAELRQGQLRLSDTTKANPTIGRDPLDAVRKLHAKTAKQLLSVVYGSNAAPRLHGRLDAIRRALSKPLTTERCLQLGIQARGFEAMLSALADMLDDELLADLSIFANDLMDLVRQFPEYRAFVEEAAERLSIAEDERNALLQLLQTFSVQPDPVVEPSLRTAIIDVETASSTSQDPATDLALVRTASNLLRAIARFVNKHAKAVINKAGKTFDSVGGNLVGTTLVAVVLGAPTIGFLLLLQRSLPEEFAFVVPLIRLAKLLLG